MLTSFEKPVHVIGGGLAGVEATWQLLIKGIPVCLHEMRPHTPSPVHQGDGLAMLVCSNSFKSENPENASQILKNEMRHMQSLILTVAETVRVPAGQALAVDRDLLSKKITQILVQHPLCHIERGEVCSLDDLPSDVDKVVATGPMTSPPLMQSLEKLCGFKRLYFYDCLAPIVFAESIDISVVFRADRYDKGAPGYLNCPLDKEAYLRLVASIAEADRVAEKPYEKMELFEGCLPIEEMVRRGEKTLAFGPMKPVGLRDPRSGKRPYAVVQLRQEDQYGGLYSMVGCQTRMKVKDQKRVFSMIPGLENAEFARYGSMHRNAYIRSPVLLNEDFSLKKDPHVYFAGQITGVEGYMESASMGLWVGWNIARRREGRSRSIPPATTAMGALIRHVTHSTGKSFEPMNINWGLIAGPLSPLPKDRRDASLESLSHFLQWLEKD
ncbi:MAG: methylenetetrahydrofolate--tRNA-(uracil(54)-C(5))-methyltransferase (FADH(2)-oxidizing) TrmFO [Deltaproteobacteria bacterium RIFCSPLOWO2_02_FULL_50_16]|nr:MAG: methylenetetrahydrofolate--tRNA-(uracil(54)-C(5))-methyltransferase (FADH(2)-oxidizing) TrmFO [Deltaproteobacteria bacterium RIFCSPLOWO2_02_FULL_50_16]OGQ68073.1 MAG: methylenetetrahydrofolate--tRNA-(uracil(54)-C(5))-methyltransferase (FADH(2)-oxidizing) TrmFO [Deltaproteobacteria bacterium RIFCSPLOWO2_12_FULL_50_11]